MGDIYIDPSVLNNMSFDADAYSTSIGHLPSSTGIAYDDIVIGNTDPHTLTIEGNLMVNGRDVMQEINEMRDVLLLLKRDVDMESKYPRLKELKDEYERTLEKYKTFETIKESK